MRTALEIAATSWPWVLVLIAGVLLLTWLAGRVSATDSAWIGITPGTFPLAPTPTARVIDEPPVAVRFEPPNALSPAQGSLLWHREVRPEALTATAVDLAVRGYLTIGSDGDNPVTWSVDRRTDAPPPRTLRTHEDVVARLRPDGGSHTTFADLALYAADPFAAHLVSDSGATRWFRRPVAPTMANDEYQPSAPLHLVPLVTLAAILIGLASLNTTLNLWPLALVTAGGLLAFGVVVERTRAGAPGRNASGRAYYEQLRGFREFIATADAERLRWEQGQDLYSEYLPWAMVFGLADHWSEVFDALAASGRYRPARPWITQPSNQSTIPRVRTIGRGLSEVTRATRVPRTVARALGRPIPRPAATGIGRSEWTRDETSGYRKTRAAGISRSSSRERSSSRNSWSSRRSSSRDSSSSRNSSSSRRAAGSSWGRSSGRSSSTSRSSSSARSKSSSSSRTKSSSPSRSKSSGSKRK